MNDKPNVLATDLDGTLIPLNDDPLHRQDLLRLTDHFQSQDDTLVFVTGRHLESTLQAIVDHNLPRPDWIICDVGTTICRRSEGGSYIQASGYAERLSSIIATSSIESVREQLSVMHELRLQEPEKQGPFKLSFYTSGNDIHAITRRVEAAIGDQPFCVIASVDPFNGEGLVDVMPRNASKGFALRWWAEATGHDAVRIIFAGDSGNDLAALTAGYLSIVVGNASKHVIDQTRASHRAEGWDHRLYIANGCATSGVLEGCLHYGLIPAE
jgi:sucrose-6-phosphatase